jgi:hypothetical protein
MRRSSHEKCDVEEGTRSFANVKLPSDGIRYNLQIESLKGEDLELG